MVNIDIATLTALDVLGADTGSSLQDLVDEALGDLLKKHHRPVATRDMFARSLRKGRRRPAKA